MRHRRGFKHVRLLTGDHLTRYGGVFLLHRFFRRLGLRRRFQVNVHFAQRNNTSSIPEMLLALLDPIILGLGRLDATDLLRRNGVFQALTGLPAYPNPVTLRRFLRRLGIRGLAKLRRVHDHLPTQLWQRPKAQRRVIFDLDSTLLTLYGHQEQARIGYNPRQQGRPSYHPWVCFEAQRRDFWHGELRPGDVHTGHGTVDLLAACFAKMPASVRPIRVRADAGFFDRKVIAAIEARRGKFVIVAKLTRPFKAQLPGLAYTEVWPGLEVAECFYQPHRWPRPYRFVVVGQEPARRRRGTDHVVHTAPITLSSPTFVFDRSRSIASTTIGRR